MTQKSTSGAGSEFRQPIKSEEGEETVSVLF